MKKDQKKKKKSDMANNPPGSRPHSAVDTRICQIMGLAKAVAPKSDRASDSPVKLGLH